MARRSKLDRKRISLIAEGIRDHGLGRERAAHRAGVGVATFYAWMARGREHATEGRQTLHSELLEAVEGAELNLESEMGGTMLDLARNAGNEGVRLTAARTILERRFPTGWSPRHTQRIEGPEGGPVQVQAQVAQVPHLFSDDQLEQLSLEQLQAAIVARYGDPPVEGEE